MGECILARTSSAIGGKDYIEGAMVVTDVNVIAVTFDAEIEAGSSYSVMINGRYQYGDVMKTFTISGQITANDNGKFQGGYVVTNTFYTVTITGYALGDYSSHTVSGNTHTVTFELNSMDKKNNYYNSFSTSTVLDIAMCRIYKIQ